MKNALVQILLVFSANFLANIAAIANEGTKPINKIPSSAKVISFALDTMKKVKEVYDKVYAVEASENEEETSEQN